MVEVVNTHILKLVEIAFFHMIVCLAQDTVLLLAALELGDVQAFAVLVVLAIFSALHELLQLHHRLALDFPRVAKVRFSGLTKEQL